LWARYQQHCLCNTCVLHPAGGMALSLRGSGGRRALGSAEARRWARRGARRGEAGVRAPEPDARVGGRDGSPVTRTPIARAPLTRAPITRRGPSARDEGPRRATRSLDALEGTRHDPSPRPRQRPRPRPRTRTRPRPRPRPVKRAPITRRGPSTRHADARGATRARTTAGERHPRRGAGRARGPPRPPEGRAVRRPAPAGGRRAAGHAAPRGPAPGGISARARQSDGAARAEPKRRGRGRLGPAAGGRRRRS